MIKEIKSGDELLAIIIPGDYSCKVINFFTPNNFSQQLAYMHHDEGHIIESHKHNHVKREINYTQEVLIIKKGKLRVDFYDNKNQYLHSQILNEGDIILLITGGHGFEVLDEIEMIEVKQGPYVGDYDKIRIPSVDQTKIKIVE